MKNFISTLLILILLIGSMVILGYFNSEKENNFLTFYADAVIDGDTFIADDKKIRIWGIDTPEKDEPYYQTATLALSSIIEDTVLECTFIDKGKYKRDVMRCYANDQDVGALMVKKGMAKTYLDGYYARDEIYAQKNNLGIWKE